jgi:hypothetical protein
MELLNDWWGLSIRLCKQTGSQPVIVPSSGGGRGRGVFVLKSSRFSGPFFLPYRVGEMSGLGGGGGIPRTIYLLRYPHEDTLEGNLPPVGICSVYTSPSPPPRLNLPIPGAFHPFHSLYQGTCHYFTWQSALYYTVRSLNSFYTINILSTRSLFKILSILSLSSIHCQYLQLSLYDHYPLYTVTI